MIYYLDSRSFYQFATGFSVIPSPNLFPWRSFSLSVRYTFQTLSPFNSITLSCTVNSYTCPVASTSIHGKSSRSFYKWYFSINLESILKLNRARLAYCLFGEEAFFCDIALPAILDSHRYEEKSEIERKKWKKKKKNNGLF